MRMYLIWNHDQFCTSFDVDVPYPRYILADLKVKWREVHGVFVTTAGICIIQIILWTFYCYGNEFYDTFLGYRFLSITDRVALLTNKHIPRPEWFGVLWKRPRTIQAVVVVATHHFSRRVDQRWLNTTCQPHVQVNTEPVETPTSNQHLAV